MLPSACYFSAALPEGVFGNLPVVTDRAYKEPQAKVTLQTSETNKIQWQKQNIPWY